MDPKFNLSLLKTSFALFPGIGPELEKKIWEYGIADWDDFLHFTPNQDHAWWKWAFPDLQEIKQAIPIWKKAYQKKDAQFFSQNLPYRDLWKVWEISPEKFCFLDIETTGIEFNSHVTVVSLYQAGEMKTYQRGKNLEYLLDGIQSDTILVSYNGKRFDVPFLEKEFHQKIPNVHLDLMNVLHDMGIKGGLKKSEEILGLVRAEEIAKIDGKVAPILWKDYQENDNLSSLQLLVAYNQEDTINLKYILEEVYRRKVEEFTNLYIEPEEW
ncbi:exonuclease [Leptospira ryugenii]|uniref:Exonuclease n=1 Tax=Leptospira ryugenii TaxID=1917863 RepID=A0A2P2DYM8_9LEPT|nr:ribonuclease H-like domain-containing protein [Leptospira ryugenii]GBF49716.1 exonuclease [Leptospira ryugenii]